MGKKGYKIKNCERGHMPPLSDEEKTIGKTFYLIESRMKFVLDQPKPQLFIRNLVEKEYKKHNENTKKKS